MKSNFKKNRILINPNFNLKFYLNEHFGFLKIIKNDQDICICYFK